MNSKKVTQPVIPAKAGIQNILKSLDSRLRGNDENGTKQERVACKVMTGCVTFHETIRLDLLLLVIYGKD